MEVSAPEQAKLMVARYYSSSLGRFLGVDPRDGEPVDPQSWNRYEYTLNNPLRFSDPAGTDPRDAISLAGLTGPGQITPEVCPLNTCSGLPPGVVAVGSRAYRRMEGEQRRLENQLVRLPAEVRRAIRKLVKASNSPSGADKRGGFHEESLVWGKDSSGRIVVSPCVPGPYSPPGSKTASTDFSPVSDAVLSQFASIEGFLHVHPRGDESTRFVQPPSQRDLDFVRGQAVYVVVGAYDQRVYFYDSKGVIGKPVSIRDVTKESP